METLARWMLRHRRVVVLLWIVAVAAIWGLGRLVPAHYSFGDSLPNTESRAAADLLQREFPGQPGEVDTIVWKVDSGSVRDPQVRQRMRQMLSAVRDLPHVTGVQSPYDAGGDRAISKDGRVAFALVNFDQGGDQLPKATVTKVIDTARGFATPAVSVDLGGYAMGQATMTISTSTSELVGVIAAAVVLFFAFGSLLGVSLPLISALASVIPAVALIGMLSRVLTVPSFASSLTILLNLGIGIDYALFLVTRQRRGLLAGQRVLDALVDTLRTAGRSVLFAGTIVCVALLGLFSLGVGYLSGMAASAAIGIAFTMAAALTLLPAMLGFFGERLLGRRERRRSLATGGRRTTDSGGWVRWAGLVARRPLVLAAVATLVTVVLALPLFSIRLGFSDQGNDPTSRTTRRAYDTLAGGFGPGFNAPLFVVASTPGGSDQAAVQRLATAIAGTPGVAAVTPAQPSPSGRVAVLQAFPTTSPQSKATQDLLHRLRDRGIPQAIRGSGLAAHVGGFTATQVDFTDTISNRLPLFIGVVVLLGAVLLLVAFRSLLVSALTAVMNLLAIGVCFGVIVAVFQWGWAGGLLGLGQPGPIDAYLPVFLFAILFGLSMDYQVFLLGRMHEAWLHTQDNRQAVSIGQIETGRVITVAGVIMVLVFLSFAAGEREMKLFGIGMGMTVLLDAFVLRTMLVPALLHLSGRASWWLPGWLDRLLPSLRIAERHAGTDALTARARPPAAQPPVPSPSPPLPCVAGVRLDREQLMGGRFCSDPLTCNHRVADSRGDRGSRRRWMMSADRIEQEVVIAAPVERVWAVLTEPEQVGQWFGQGTPAQIDLRPGGTMVLDHGAHGTFPTRIEKVDPPHYFSFRWASAYPGEEATEKNSTLVEFALTPEADGTRLRLVESGFASLAIPPHREATASYDSHARGWTDLLGDLRRHAERLAA